MRSMKPSIAVALVACLAPWGLLIFACVARAEPPTCEAPKIPICHVPPGNPDNPLDLCIAEEAWVKQGHNNHPGDLKEACPVACSITCGEPYKTGPATLSMDVTSTGHKMTGPYPVSIEGPVTPGIGTCKANTDRKQACTWSATGDPTFEGPQTIAVLFTQANLEGKIKNRVICEMGTDGGLPVELIWFEVE